MAAATSQDAAPAGDLMDGGWLDAGWVTLPAEALPGLPGEPRTGERRFVLLHPTHGIAILDLWSSVAALPELEVAASLDAELALAGFLRRHDPRLPVRRIYLAQAALPQLTGVMARAYAGVPPLELPEGWIDAVRGRLAVPQKPAGLTARMPRLRMAGRYRLAAGIAALLTAGVVGLLAAGGHVGGQRAQPVAEAAGTPAVAATLAAAVPEPAPAEPALSPATPPPAVSTGPLAASTATAPPAAAEPPAAMPPDPARVAAAPAPAEPALPPAAAPPAASAGPPAARAAIVPPVAVEPLPAVMPDPARIAAAPAFSPATPQPAASAGPLAASAAIAPPPALGPAPVMPPNPAHAAEGPTYGPAAAPPRSIRQQPRSARRAASARSSRGRTLNSGGSFIRQQSLQYATGNGS